jgi:hypothetical protein
MDNQAAGRPNEARVHYAAALALATQIGDPDQQARAHTGIAWVLLANGEPGRAREEWQQALTMYIALGVPEADEIRAQLATLDVRHPAERSIVPDGPSARRRRFRLSLHSGSTTDRL